MKRFLPLVLAFITLACDQSRHQQQAEVELAKEVFSSLHNDFQLHVMDCRFMRTPKLKKVAVDFTHYGELDVRQARLIMHHAARLMIDSFNTLYHGPRDFHHFPLTENDLEISISFVDPVTHRMQSHGAVSHAALIDGRVHYSTYVDDEQRHQTLLQESFITYQPEL